MIEIDGSILEGGGQIIRTAVALSVILGIQIDIKNIRAGRAKPGLSQQHVQGIALATLITSSTVYGNSVGSTSIELTPNTLPIEFQTSYSNSIGTAGAISLVLQLVIPCLLFLNDQHNSITLNITGGTNVDHSPPIDHQRGVLLPILEKFGARVSMSINRRGFYPVGGGNVSVRLNRTEEFQGLDLTEQGEPLSVNCNIFGEGPFYASEAIILKEKLLVALSTIFRSRLSSLQQSMIVEISEAPLSSDTKNETKRQKRINASLGLQITVVTDTGCILSANHLLYSREGGLGSHIEVMKTATDDLLLLLDSKACVDEFTADQLIIYMALAHGPSKLLCVPVKSSSSMHLETSMHIVTLMTGIEFTVKTDENNCRLVTCHGRL